MMRLYLSFLMNKIFGIVNYVIEKLIQFDDSNRRKSLIKKVEAEEKGVVEDKLELSFWDKLRFHMSPKRLSLSEQIDLYENLKIGTEFQSPLSGIFDSFRRRQDISPYARVVCDTIYKSIRVRKLYQCMEDTKAFSLEHITQIKIMEGTTANFSEVYGSIIASLIETRKRRAALRIIIIEPSLILAVILGVELAVSLYIVPSFISDLDKSTVMPPTIKSYLALQDILLHHKLEYFTKSLFVVAILYLLSLLRMTKVFLHWFYLQIPKLNEAIQKWELSKFFSGVSQLIGAGAPMQDAVSISLSLIGNEVIRKSLQYDLRDMSRVSNLANSLRECIYLEARVRNQLAMTQRSDLASTIASVSREYNDYVKSIMDAPMKFIGPASLMVGVGYLFARLLPLYQDFQTIFSTFTSGR